jgi:hypothetical protein
VKPNQETPNAIIYGSLVFLVLLIVAVLMNPYLLLWLIGIVAVLTLALACHWAVRELVQRRVTIFEAIFSVMVVTPVIFFCFAVIFIAMLGFFPAAVAKLIKSKYREALRAAYRWQEQQPPLHVTSLKQLRRLRAGRRFYFTARLSSEFKPSKDNLVYYYEEEYRSGDNIAAGWYSPMGNAKSSPHYTLASGASLLLGDDTLPLSTPPQNKARFYAVPVWQKIKFNLMSSDEIPTEPDAPAIGTRRISGIRYNSAVRVEGQMRIAPKKEKDGLFYELHSIEQLEPQNMIIRPPDEEEFNTTLNNIAAMQYKPAPRFSTNSYSPSFRPSPFSRFGRKTSGDSNDEE